MRANEQVEELSNQLARAVLMQHNLEKIIGGIYIFMAVSEENPCIILDLIPDQCNTVPNLLRVLKDFNNVMAAKITEELNKQGKKTGDESHAN